MLQSSRSKSGLSSLNNISQSGHLSPSQKHSSKYTAAKDTYMMSRSSLADLHVIENKVADIKVFCTEDFDRRINMYNGALCIGIIGTNYSRHRGEHITGGIT